MIALAHYKRRARRPRTVCISRHAIRPDATLALEIERHCLDGRVVRILRTRGPHLDIALNGRLYLVRPVPCRDVPVGTFTGVVDALRGGDHWADRLLSGECDEEEFGGFDGDAA